MKNSNKIFEFIKNNNYKKIIVSGHVRPDVDAFFSSMALVDFLRSIGYEAYYAINDLPLTKILAPFINEENKDYIVDIRDGIKDEYDLVIIVDTSALDRMPEKIVKIFDKVPHIIIDHHMDYKNSGVLNVIDDKCASTGMLIYRLVKEYNMGFTKNFADYIYLTILGDTGGFANSNTGKEVFSVASELVDFGVLPNILYRKLFARVSLDKLKFLSYIYGKIDFLLNKKVAYVTYDMSMLEKYGLDKGDIEGIAGTLIRIDGVRVGLFIKKEGENYLRVSLRSVPGVNIRTVAVKYGGGGHKQASGMSFDGTPEELLKKISKDLELCI